MKEQFESATVVEIFENPNCKDKPKGNEKLSKEDLKWIEDLISFKVYRFKTKLNLKEALKYFNRCTQTLVIEGDHISVYKTLCLDKLMGNKIITHENIRVNIVIVQDNQVWLETRKEYN